MLIEPTTKNIKAALMKYAADVEFDDTGRKKIRATAKCQGCGEDIRSDENLSGVEFSITKRGTGVFFHHGCFGNVWNRKITL